METDDWRCNVFVSKKRGEDVGRTKIGKGTKLMLLTDQQGLPVSLFVCGANIAEVHAIETLVEVRVADQRPDYLLYDKAADANWLRDALDRRGIEQVTRHRKNRKNIRQDGRTARRLTTHRWKVERTMSWLKNSRRLEVRREYYPQLFEAFAHLACILLYLNRY